MTEEDIYPELRHTLLRHGAFVPDRAAFVPAKVAVEAAAKVNAAPTKANPDYVGVWAPPAYSGVFEVKYDESNFNFRELDRQTGWMEDPLWKNHIRWVWLGMGLGRERDTFLPTWDAMQVLRRHYNNFGLSGIPHIQAHALEHRELNLNARHNLASYRLEKGDQILSKTGKPTGKFWWNIPDEHPFWRLHNLVKTVTSV